jgi:mitochondrial fission protein ELM1
MLDLTSWALTEGFAGMENQCVGLAEAVGLRCEIKRVRPPRMPLKYLSPSLWPNPLAGVVEGVVLAPPWPDVLISSGRGSVAAALAIRRAPAAEKPLPCTFRPPYVLNRNIAMLVFHI